MLKKIKKIQQYIKRVQVLVNLEKSYLSYIVSNEDAFYMKIAALDEVYNFLVLSFLI
jgi:hypothetical protein